MPNLVHAVIPLTAGRLLASIHSERTPTDLEWERIVQSCSVAAREAGGYEHVYSWSISDGGTPTVGHHKESAIGMRNAPDGYLLCAAYLTDSLVKRGWVTVVATGLPRARVFALSEAEAWIRYLPLKKGELARVRDVFATLQSQVNSRAGVHALRVMDTLLAQSQRTTKA